MKKRPLAEEEDVEKAPENAAKQFDEDDPSAGLIVCAMLHSQCEQQRRDNQFMRLSRL